MTIQYIRQPSMNDNQRQIRILSPASSVKSSRSLYHSIKLKIPKNKKLNSFFANLNQSNNLLVQGKSKVLNEGQRRLNKASSLKTLTSSSLVKKINQNLQANSSSPVENQLECNFKDDSQTRSGLTINEDYGLVHPQQKQVYKKALLPPKTPKQIRATSGDKKILFPIKTGNRNQKQKREKAKKNLNSLQYTFGLQGFNFNFNSKK